MDGDVDNGQVVRVRLGGYFTGDEAAPGFVAFVDDLCRIFLVFSFA